LIFKFFIIKEIKKFPFFFFLLSSTLFLGTLALIGISVVSTQVQEKLKANANQLLTSDLAISARRELFPQEKIILDKIFQTTDHRSYEVIDIYSMVTRTKNGNSRLVEIRSTEDGFPFYGAIKTAEGSFSNGNLYISSDLADLWDMKPGEELKIGDVVMNISGVVVEDSSMGLRGFSLAPRLYFPLHKLKETGLIRPGATGSFVHHYKLQDFSLEKIKNLKSTLNKSLTDTAIKISLPEDSSEQTGRAINAITNFMSLSGLVGLILALVGVFYLYQSHLVSRLKDLCLVNLFGLSKVKILLGILIQFSFIFSLIMILEILVLVPVYKLVAPKISNYLGLLLSSEINFSQVLIEIPLLYVLSLTILSPLLLGLLRTTMGAQLKSQKISLGKFKAYDFIPFLVSLWLFSSYLGHSFKIGNIFFFSLMVIFLISTITIKCVQWLIRKIILGKGLLLPNIEAGLALRGLVRSGHKLTLSFLSLVIGATLISLILQLDKMIVNEFSNNSKRPSLFLFDIQEEQIDSLAELAKENGSPLAFITPMIRARLEKVNDIKFVRKKKDFDFRSSEEDQDTRFRNNGMNLTYRDYLTEAEKIIDGRPFPPGGATPDRLPFISIEKRWSQRMGVKIGDKLTFDVQGVEFDGEVINIKEIKWTSFYPNFFVTIEPSLIEAAPKTFLSILPEGPKEIKRSLQQKVVEKFPNISFIDVEEMVKKMSLLFDKSRLAIELISWLSLGVGLVILYGLSHDQVYRRSYDLALMKVLGIRAGQIRLHLIFEFGAIFFSATGLGLVLGWLLAQLIAREVFKLSFSVDWLRLTGTWMLLSLLCLGTIFLASWRAVQTKPRVLLSET
jgi:putative ABC transport system permease protein